MHVIWLSYSRQFLCIVVHVLHVNVFPLPAASVCSKSTPKVFPSILRKRVSTFIQVKMMQLCQMHLSTLLIKQSGNKYQNFSLLYATDLEGTL